MGLTQEDIKALKEVLDERYVRISTCESVQKDIRGKLSNDDKRIEKMLLMQEHSAKALQKNNWLTTTILGIILSIVVAMVLKTVGVF